MSKYLLIASAVLLLCSTGLSFVNKGKLAASLDEARTAHASLAGAQTDAAKARTALTKSQADLKTASQQAADAQTQTTGLKSQIDDLNTQLKTASANVADRDAKLADLRHQLESLPKTGPDANTGDIAKQIEDLKHQRDEGVVVIEGLKDQVKVAQNQVAELQKSEVRRQQGIMMNGLRGRVLAVDRNWNFVVIDLGDNKGVNANATMLIQRGGELVGKVKITSVEPSQSIADIIPNSVPPGVSVQAGDTVVFPGT